MKVSTKEFGTLPDGRRAQLFCFESKNGLQVSITNFGGNITSIKMPDKNGLSEEITAGFPDLESYLAGHPYFGVIAGRFANRIAKGRFRIGNVEYHLPINNGENHLHGGPDGFHVKLWNFQLTEEKDSARLALNYISPDLEEGYPGNLNTTVTYTITDKNEIIIRYEALTDMPTHVNLTNHTYFNLGGFKNPIYDHHLSVDSGFVLDINEGQIPTGKLISTEDNSFDLRKDKPLDKAIESYGGGIDHCLVLYQARNMKKPVAKLAHHASGRKMVVYTTQPGIQIYTGNHLDGSLTGHNGTKYEKHSAICLETQHYPDSPNHAEFPSTLLKPNGKYDHEARFVFEIISA